MGLHTYAGFAKFAVRLYGDENIEICNLVNYMDAWNEDPFDFDGWHCPHNEWLEDFDDISPVPIVKGNICFPAEDGVIDGDYKIYFVNESPDECCGGFEPTIFAMNEQSIKQFCKDFGISEELIETDTIVYQTL